MVVMGMGTDYEVQLLGHVNLDLCQVIQYRIALDPLMNA